MAEAHQSTIFDRLSVGQAPPPPTPEAEVNSAAAVSDDWRRATFGADRVAPWPRRGKATGRRRRRGTARSEAESTSFVGLMQQLSVDGRELFELAERGHFGVVDSTATKDDSGGPITFTSPDAYLSLSSVTESSAFSIYFRVRYYLQGGPKNGYPMLLLG